MAPGLLFRSARLSSLTAGDVAKLRAFDLKLVCDLRAEPPSKRVRAALGDSTRLVNIPLHEGMTERESRRRLLGCLFGKAGAERFAQLVRAYYRHIAFEQGARIREVINLLASEPWPALIHCSAGKDRTGFLVAIIQLFLGVPYELVRQDYLLTNEYFAPILDGLLFKVRLLTLFQVPRERLLLIFSVQPAVLDELYASILERHSTIEGYLKEACQIEASTLQNLKQRLLT